MPNGERSGLQVHGEQGRFRIRSEGRHPVSDVLELLGAFNSAYNGLSLFEGILEAYADEAVAGNSRHSRNRWLRFMLKLTDQGIRITLSLDDRLILARAELSSPGFWEFMGSLMPLEVLRHYLIDRHERWKDRKYRNREEERQLVLENELQELRVLREKIAICRELGMTDRELSGLRSRLLDEPFRRIDHVDARGMILLDG